MAGKIKGITIDINGNVTPLEKALESVNKKSAETTKELRQIDKALKLNPNSVELIAQKQQLLAEQIKHTSEKLKTLKDAEKEVEEQFKKGDIGADAYRAFKREIEVTQETLKGYKQKLEGISLEQERLSDSSKRLATFFKVTKTDIEQFRHELGDKLTNAIKNGTATSKDLDKALDIVGKSALGSKTDIQDLKSALDSLDDGASLDTVNHKIKEIGETAETSSEHVTNKLFNLESAKAGAQAAKEVSQKLVEFGKKSQEAFRELDEGFDTIITKTGITDDKILESFESIYKSITQDIPVDNFEMVGASIGEVNTQFGLTGESLEETAKDFLKFANINRTDVSNSVILSKKALEAYGLSVDWLGETLDEATYLSQKTGVSIETIFQKATEAAPQIKELGLSFSEGASLIAKFEQNGVDSSAALNALSKAAVNFAKKGKTLSDGLKETIDKIQGSKDATEKLSLAAEVFGTKSAPKMVDAIERGQLSFGDLEEASEKSMGTVANTFEATLDPIDKQQVAMQDLKIIMAEFGAQISEALQPLLDILLPVLKFLSEGFKKLPAPIKSVITVIGILVAVLGALAPIAVGVFAAISAGAAAAEVPIGAFVASLLPIIGTILAVVAVVTTLAMIFKHLWDTNEGFRKSVTVAWEFIQKLITGVVSEISKFVMSVFGGVVTWWNDNQQLISKTVETVWGTIQQVISTVMSVLQPILSVAWANIQAIITGVWDNIKVVVETAINVVLGIIKTVMQLINGDWAGAWETMKSVFSGIWEGIKTVVDNTIHTIASIISNVIGGIADNIGNVMNGISSVVTTVWDTIKSTIDGAINGAKNIVDGAIQAIRGFFNFKFEWPHIPLPHFSISGSINPLDWFTQGLPKIGIEWYAKGGILTRPTVFGQNGNNLMVGGEAGKEAVLPLNEKNLSMIGRGIASTMQESLSHVTLNVVVNHPVIKEEEDIYTLSHQVADIISREMLRQSYLTGGTT
ncbi:phage tail tape measure protein [Carnobacteriaceae bacterium zg-ZUI78]|nr:phage tail tape measure protein [Carnobacteriaceae bacterium zg-ZUI78]